MGLWREPEALLFFGAANQNWVEVMPKMKTHKGSKKRFRVTAKGKLKRRQAGKKHLLSSKTGKRKRHLRGTIIETDKMARKYIHMMGGEA
jgi:large subunit ribosomal protein L35